MLLPALDSAGGAADTTAVDTVDTVTADTATDTMGDMDTAMGTMEDMDTATDTTARRGQFAAHRRGPPRLSSDRAAGIWRPGVVSVGHTHLTPGTVSMGDGRRQVRGVASC